MTTCAACGTEIHYNATAGEWHAEPNAQGQHYVNVCGGRAGGHTPERPEQPPCPVCGSTGKCIMFGEPSPHHRHAGR